MKSFLCRKERTVLPYDVLLHTPTGCSLAVEPMNDSTTLADHPWSTRQDAWMVVVLCGIHLFLYLCHFDDAALFQVDAERDLTSTLGLVTGGPYPIRGPHIGDTQFFLGSCYLLLLSIPMLFTQDPVLIRGFFVLLATGALGLLYRVLRVWVRLEVAALCLCWLMASGFWFENLRQLWHSTLLPIFFVTWIWLVIKTLQSDSRRWFVLAAIPMAICVQLHATMVTLILAMGALLVAHARRLGWKAISMAIGVGALAAIPLWMGIFASENLHTVELDWWIQESRSASLLDVLSYLAWSTIPGWGGPSAHTWTSLPYGTAIVGFLLPALAIVGTVHALRKGPGLTVPRLLVLVALMGIGIQLFVLSRDINARYLHANFIPILILAAVGLEALLQKTRLLRRFSGPLMLVAGCGLLATGMFRDAHPRDRGSAMCGLVAQRDIAAVLSTDFGIAEPDLNTRLHGMPCRHRASGYAYFYRVNPPSETTLEETRTLDRHVFVMPAEVPLVPNALEVFEQRLVGPAPRTVRVTAYRPAIDYAAMTRRVHHQESTGATALPEPGRRSHDARASVRTETIQVPVHPGPEKLFLRFWQGHGNACDVRGKDPSGAPLTPRLIAEASRHGERLYELPLTAHTGGTLEVVVGPCNDFDAVELF